MACIEETWVSACATAGCRSRAPWPNVCLAPRSFAAEAYSPTIRRHRCLPPALGAAASAVFSQVVVDDELGTVVWPNGADMDPDVLHGDRPAA
jgi:hypothetical protein